MIKSWDNAIFCMDTSWFLVSTFLWIFALSFFVYANKGFSLESILQTFKKKKKKKKKRESNIQKWTYGGCKNYSRHLRASTLKNDTLSYFIILKNYFINYTIPFYNTPYIQKLYYFTFSLKYHFF